MTLTASHALASAEVVKMLGSAALRRMALLVPTSAAATFGFFVWRLSTGVPFALVQTETFTVLAVCQWFTVLNCRSETKSALSLSILKNYWLPGGLVLVIANPGGKSHP